jgi:LuxR family maltose regulon positive regulatory protein
MGEGKAAPQRWTPVVIDRPRLRALLDDSAASVVLLVAAAGYGKTTLARQWLSHGARSAAWCRLTSASLDIAVLASSIAAACSSIVPSVRDAVGERLRATRKGPSPDPAILADTLADNLSGWPENAWLVLDDYQALVESPGDLFVKRLVDQQVIRILILTRRRPSWVTARHLLYGEAYELGANTLAMTPEEASIVLHDESERHVFGLHSITQGWPAVIGLAALTGASVAEIEDLVPETLHTFLAEELFQCLGTELKQALLDLALAPTISRGLGSELFGDKGEDILGRCADSGFLTSFGIGTYELHPLLRQFLLSKIDPLDRTSRNKFERIANFALRHRNWDEASLLLERRASDVMIDRFVESALDELLLEGRVATLRRWIAIARNRRYESPQIDLAEAELLFREGRPKHAEALALAAAESLPRDHDLVARALNLAALAAHFDNRVEEALSRHIDAASAARSIDQKRNAIWGQFITRAELGQKDGAEATIRLFEETSPTSLEDRMRQGQAHITFAVRFGGIQQALRRWQHLASFTDARCDPLVKTGFLHIITQALLLSARYAETLDLTAHQEAEARRLGLDFVLPHTLCLRVGAQMGMRDFEGARTTLATTSDIAGRLGDAHSAANLTVLEAKLLLIEAAPAKAVDLLRHEPEEWSNPGMAGEFFGTCALALACGGDGPAAREMIDESASWSEQTEALMPRLWAEAVLNHVEQGEELGIERAFGIAFETGHLDSIVLTYRAYRPALEVLGRIDSCRPGLKLLIRAARDYSLGRRVQLGVLAPADHAQSALTPRELEVLGLVRRGHSNAEIAKTLWIEESTAKVHVRNILRKLGARSRTEAAVLAAELESTGEIAARARVT